MDTGTALGGTGLFLSIMGIIYSAINHKHIRSRCCGKVYDMAIDIGETSKVHIETAPEEAVGNDKEGKSLPHNRHKVLPDPF